MTIGIPGGVRAWWRARPLWLQVALFMSALVIVGYVQLAAAGWTELPARSSDLETLERVHDIDITRLEVDSQRVHREHDLRISANGEDLSEIKGAIEDIRVNDAAQTQALKNLEANSKDTQESLRNLDRKIDDIYNHLIERPTPHVPTTAIRDRPP